MPIPQARSPSYRFNNDNDRTNANLERQLSQDTTQPERRRLSTSSREQRPRSPWMSVRSPSSPLANDRQAISSGVSHPTLSPDRDTSTMVSMERRGLSPTSPPTTGHELAKVPRRSMTSSEAAPTKTRDPRLLRNNFGTLVSPSDESVTVAKSSGKVESLKPSDIHRGNESLTPEVTQQMQTMRSASEQISPSWEEAQRADLSHQLTNLLGSLLENASSMAALKYEYDKVNAKFEHRTSKERKISGHAKSFPAFAETSARQKNQSEKLLKDLDRQLGDYRTEQMKSLSAVPDIVQTLRPLNATNKERQRSELVERCITTAEDLESNLDELKFRFQQQESDIARLENGRRETDGKIIATEARVEELSTQLESSRAHSSKLQQKQGEFLDSITSNNSEVQSSLSALKTDVEQHRHANVKDKTTIDAEAAQISTRMNLAESHHEAVLKTTRLCIERLENLERSSNDQQNELQQLKATLSLHKKAYEPANSASKGEVNPHYSLRESWNDERMYGTGAEQLGILRSDISSLKAELQELKEQHKPSQDVVKPGEKLAISMIREDKLISHTEDSENSDQLINLKLRIDTCLETVHDLHDRLTDQRKDEDRRDEVVGVEVEEIRVSFSRAQEELERRISSVESAVRSQIPAYLNGALQLQEFPRRLLNHEIQNSTAGPGSPRAPPMPQTNQSRQLPKLSNSLPPTQPQPTMLELPAEVSERLVSAEASTVGLQQQLSAMNTALVQLNHRFNNLSTTPIVQAMVHQMQLMYPYASDAQKEITNIKQSFGPFKDVRFKVENLVRFVDDHRAAFAVIRAYGERLDVLEAESGTRQARQERLVEHVKKEGEKLQNEVRKHQVAVENTTSRVANLEAHREGQSDRLHYLPDGLAERVQEECAKVLNGIVERLDALEVDAQRQNLLKAFTGRGVREGNRSNLESSQAPHHHEGPVEPPVVKAEGRASKPPLLSHSSRLSKETPTPNSMTTRKKRKRKRFKFSDVRSDCSDRSEDETYSPTVNSSLPKHKTRGS